MTTFNLTAGGTAYTLSTDGAMSTAAGPSGKWTTDGKTTNHIVVTKTADGSHTDVDVKWSFNTKNHLCHSQGAAQVFNFTAGKAHPRFTLDANNKLSVIASPTTPLFTFQLERGNA